LFPSRHRERRSKRSDSTRGRNRRPRDSPHWRALAYGAALAFGVAIGLVRAAGGGHFFSDVVFAGVFMFLVIWIMHGLLLRWRAGDKPLP